MKVNLRNLIRRYWWVDKRDSYGIVRIETKREGFHYYHRAYIMEPGVHNENNNIIEIVAKEIFATTQPDVEVTLTPVGNGLYRSSDYIYTPFTGAHIAKAIEADGILIHIRSAGSAYYLPVASEDSAVSFASFHGGGSSGVSKALAHGMAYLANGLYPPEWVSALPTVRPVHFFLYYEHGSGTALQVYDRNNLDKPVINKVFSGCTWVNAISLTDMLYYLNRALGHNFKVRDRDKYFTALIADFYTKAEGGVL
jgi:hypothetical protein